MQKSKLMFSDAELQMASSEEVILTKNRIIEKVYEVFGGLGNSLFDSFTHLRADFPDALNNIPKISKGEQYEGLPWVMLDYPRCFNRNSGHLALRVMFWWGNYFLVQLHVSGHLLLPVAQKAEEWATNGKISGSGWWAGFPEDPWNFRLPQKGMEPVESCKWQAPLSNSGIFKLMKQESLQGDILSETVEKMAAILRESLEKPA